MNKHVDIGSLFVIIITLILFVVDPEQDEIGEPSLCYHVKILPNFRYTTA